MSYQLVPYDRGSEVSSDGKSWRFIYQTNQVYFRSYLVRRAQPGYLSQASTFQVQMLSDWKKAISLREIRPGL